MVALPEFESPVVSAIYAAYEGRAQFRRGHLGASQIGKKCERDLWYSFRWASHKPTGSNKSSFDGRMLRLFETGQLEEARMVENLRSVGCEVHEVDSKTGKQFWYSSHGGHFSGSLDGAAVGVPGAEKTWHLCEFKTHNAKSFTELKRAGVQNSKPQHLAQMVMYMGWSGLTRALYLAVNKDTDELYAERIPEDPARFQILCAKALRVISAVEPCEKNVPESECKWCDHRLVCEGGALPAVHCRTCAHARPDTDGSGARWVCTRDNMELTKMVQERGCDNHLFTPALVTFGKVVSNGDDHVVYIRQDGAQFSNCAPSGFAAFSGESYLSRDLEGAR
jgi:hypothetical protein